MPIIFTTGQKERPVVIRSLPGETEECIRASAGNVTATVADKLGLLRSERDREWGYSAVRSLGRIGMDPHNAARLLGAAAADRAGMGVRFKIQFLGDETGGPRIYYEFQPTRINLEEYLSKP